MKTRMKLALGWLLVIGLHTACSDDGSDDGGDGPAPRTFGAMCTTVADTDSTECDSGVCTDAFDQLGYNVCSQKCTPGDGSTCPTGSEGKKCNMRGYCKP